MTTRMRAPITLVACALLVAACVPPSAGRASPSASAAISATPLATVPATPGGPTPMPSFVRPVPTPLPTFVAYVVRAGDTLLAIARAYGTSALSIAYWNRAAHPSLDPESEGYAPNRIQVGWTLVLIPGVTLDGGDLPEPSATPSPPPSPTPTASPNAVASPTPSIGAASRRVEHGPRSSATVALTFDMGGRLDPALDIMAWLIDEEVPATVFPAGKSGTTTTVGRQAVAMVAAHPDLFDLGNHSWSHPDFRDLTDAAIADQLSRTESALVALVGVSPRPWFRPPYGGLDAGVLAEVGEAGYGYSVMWDVDTIDWRPESDGGPSTAAIVDKVVSKAEGGSIVLMHLGGFNTLEALPGIVDGLRAKRLRPVTLGEMFGE